MSRYPGNPWWHQATDTPFEITSRFDWDTAAAAGHLTAEHVLLRLENILEYDLAEGKNFGLSDDGFLNALVADGWRLERGVTVRMYPNDHPPPHVHLRFRSHPRLDLRVSIETGELLDDDAPDGWAKRIRSASSQVLDQRSILIERWNVMQNSVPPSG